MKITKTSEETMLFFFPQLYNPTDEMFALIEENLWGKTSSTIKDLERKQKKQKKKIGTRKKKSKE